MKKFLFIMFGMVSLSATDIPVSEPMQKIMNQEKYAHATWGLYVKDLKTGEILYDWNSDKFFLPASTTKLFSTAALLNAFSENYRFKTPIIATAPIENGILKGNLVLIGQGDLTFGGRQAGPDAISFTKMDHLIANAIPGVILTKEDPLAALNDLAKQLYEKGLRKVQGDIVIDDSLFKTEQKRGMMLSPIMINENVIDFTINPSQSGEGALLTYRPHVAGYHVDNQLKTVGEGGPLNIEIVADESGHEIIVKGTVPQDQKDLIRIYPIQDPKAFARAALIEALQKQGILVSIQESIGLGKDYSHLPPLAVWVSPPLSEYVKLILKVSHNLGADLIPLLLASKGDEKDYNQGMRLLGDFLIDEVKLSLDAFVFIDAAGGDGNRLTLQAEIQLLKYMHHKAPETFQSYYEALPVLGKDGSLEDVAKNSPGAGKIHAKTGTGASFNLATGKLFLTTQALAGYISGKNGHLYAYMLVVNNGTIPTTDAILSVFEDEGQISSLIYSSME